MKNLKLMDAIKKLELDASKKYVLVISNQHFTKEDAHIVSKIMNEEYPQTLILMTRGDVREAAEVFALDELPPPNKTEVIRKGP